MTETDRMLSRIVGGQDLLNWFGGKANFCDAEVVQFCLTRDGPCLLMLEVIKREGESWARIRVTLKFSDVGLVELEGFSHQNVIGSLSISEAPKRNWHPSLFGIGFAMPEHLIKIEPCAGSFGEIFCTIQGISFVKILTP